MLDQITPLILTYNEESNLRRVLERLRWAGRVVVLDSGSTDTTIAIARSFVNVEVFTRAFDSHAAQWNHGLQRCGIDTAWVLALDADYLVPDAMIEEMRSLAPSSETAGYLAQFRYCIQGEPLSGSLYPPVTVLFRRSGSHFEQEGHTQRVRVRGDVRALVVPIDHDDRKSSARWLASQDRYAALEAELLLKSPWHTLRWQDRLRRLLVVTPWLVPLYCLIIGRCLLDGRAGWYYAMQRGVAEAVLSLKLLEAGLNKKTG